jgi:hypothetical protein
MIASRVPRRSRNLPAAATPNTTLSAKPMNRIASDIDPVSVGEVRRFVAAPPFDVATNAGPLIRADWLITQHGVQSRAQIFFGNRIAVVSADVIELAALDQPAILIEQEKIRRAGGRI